MMRGDGDRRPRLFCAGPETKPVTLEFLRNNTQTIVVTLIRSAGALGV